MDGRESRDRYPREDSGKYVGNVRRGNAPMLLGTPPQNPLIDMHLAFYFVSLSINANYPIQHSPKKRKVKEKWLVYWSSEMIIVQLASG